MKKQFGQKLLLTNPVVQRLVTKTCVKRSRAEFVGIDSQLILLLVRFACVEMRNAYRVLVGRLNRDREIDGTTV